MFPGRRGGGLVIDVKKAEEVTGAARAMSSDDAAKGTARPVSFDGPSSCYKSAKARPPVMPRARRGFHSLLRLLIRYVTSVNLPRTLAVSPRPAVLTLPPPTWPHDVPMDVSCG